MRQPRLPKLDNPRIAINSLKAKEEILFISEKTGESLTEIIVRLVASEHRKLGGKF